MKNYFVYLDGLRDSGATNMWGAGPYLSKKFGLDKGEAGRILVQWMETFDSTKSPEERALEAQAK